MFADSDPTSCPNKNSVAESKVNRETRSWIENLEDESLTHEKLNVPEIQRDNPPLI